MAGFRLRPTLLPLVASAMALLAGCTGTQVDLGALEAVDLADGDAKAWAADAVLVGVLGVEARGVNATLAAQLGTPLPALDDVAFGDGRTPAWYVSYFSPASGHRLVLEVTRDGTTTMADAPMPALADRWAPAEANRAAWQMDSMEAMRRIRVTNSTLDASVSGDGAATALYGFDLDRGTWLVLVNTPSARMQATVEPATGNVAVDVRDGNGLLPPPPAADPPAPIKKSVATTASADPLNLAGEPPCSTPTHACDRTPITLNGTFTIDASLSWTLPINDYDFYVVDAGGAILLQGASDVTSAGQTQETLAGPLGPGQYEIVVAPWGAVADTFTLEATFSS